MTPDFRMLGGQGDAGLGLAVSSAGDVNGDGFDDLLLGAPYHDENFYDAGRVYVIHGSASGLTAVPDWTAAGQAQAGWFGYAVAGGADLNNDGYDDVVVGTAHTDRVFVYYGSATGLPGEPSWVYKGSGSVGASVAVAGDVNGDGYPDVVLGAPGNDEVLVFAGGADGLGSSPLTTVSGGGYFGVSVAAAGDVNADGLADVIVGADFYRDTFDEEGAAFLFLGTAEGISDAPVWKIVGGQEFARMGTSVAIVDVNNDGGGDLLVGAPLFTAGEKWEGAVVAYYGLPAQDEGKGSAVGCGCSVGRNPPGRHSAFWLVGLVLLAAVWRRRHVRT